jgi:ribonuclease HII
MPKSNFQLWDNELPLREEYGLVAGVDEAGRGPIAGPVVIASVILNPELPISGLNDSKKLSHKQREMLFEIITKGALTYSIVTVSHQRIDEINILQAVMEGMEQAVNALNVTPAIALIDGNRIPKGLKVKALACIKGDGNYASIAAASILAKVTRDRIMTEHDVTYPAYGFSRHKGYPTKMHIQALQEHGVCPIHRLTYAPVRQLELSIT